jgi:hypothetical protein
MFLVQQVIAMGQAIINTEVGATAALKTDPTGFMSMLTRGLGYASVGVIAAQTVDGIFHGGESYVPKEASYYLDKGERVLSPRQNKDLTTYLANRENTVSGIQVTIKNYGSDKVETSKDSNGNLMVTIGKMIDNAVDKGIIRNLKQGYPLSNAIKGK